MPYLIATGRMLTTIVMAHMAPQPPLHLAITLRKLKAVYIASLHRVAYQRLT